MTKITVKMLRDTIKKKKILTRIKSSQYLVWPLRILSCLREYNSERERYHQVGAKFGIYYTLGFNLGYDGVERKDAISHVPARHMKDFLSGWINGRRIKRYL